jgi:hypothetical protein
MRFSRPDSKLAQVYPLAFSPATPKPHFRGGSGFFSTNPRRSAQRLVGKSYSWAGSPIAAAANLLKDKKYFHMAYNLLDRQYNFK